MRASPSQAKGKAGGPVVVVTATPVSTPPRSAGGAGAALMAEPAPATPLDGLPLRSEEPEEPEALLQATAKPAGFVTSTPFVAPSGSLLATKGVA